MTIAFYYWKFHTFAIIRQSLTIVNIKLKIMLFSNNDRSLTFDWVLAIFVREFSVWFPARSDKWRWLKTRQILSRSRTSTMDQEFLKKSKRNDVKTLQMQNGNIILRGEGWIGPGNSFKRNLYITIFSWFSWW